MARLILHDVTCPESYECSDCHTWFEQEKHQSIDDWYYCPICGRMLARRIWQPLKDRILPQSQK